MLGLFWFPKARPCIKMPSHLPLKSSDAQISFSTSTASQYINIDTVMYIALYLICANYILHNTTPWIDGYGRILISTKSWITSARFITILFFCCNNRVEGYLGQRLGGSPDTPFWSSLTHACSCRHRHRRYRRHCNHHHHHHSNLKE